VTPNLNEDSLLALTRPYPMFIAGPLPQHRTATLFQIPVTLFQTPVTLFQTPVTLFQAPVTLFQAPVTLFQTPVTLFQTPVTLFQAPVTLFQAPVTLFQAPGTLFLVLISGVVRTIPDAQKRELKRGVCCPSPRKRGEGFRQLHVARARVVHLVLLFGEDQLPDG
jgi:hypothetical protein